MPREAEPTVLTADVRTILRRAIRPGEDEGDTVTMLAHTAKTSTRTVYRVLGGEYRDTMNLDLADRLVLAAGSHLVHTRLQMPDGRLVDYLDA